jgi:hypothetical protein
MDYSKFWNRTQERIHFVYAENPHNRKTLQVNMERWEQAPLNFFEYRDRIKKIVASYMLDYETISFSDALKMLGDPEVVFLPIDDDDIVHPQVLPMLQSKFEDRNVKALEWTTWCYGAACDKESFSVELPPTPSNCYAIRADVADYMLLIHHLAFAESDIKREKMEDRLGLRFLHRASMWRCQRELIDVCAPLERVALPEELQWASGVIGDFRLLTDCLQRKADCLQRKMML